MRLRRISFVFVVVAMIVMAATTTAAQEPSPACLELDAPDPGLDPAIESVYLSVAAIRDGMVELGEAIESTEDFSVGWTASGDAAAAIGSIQAGLDMLDADIGALAEVWGLSYEPGQGFEIPGPRPPAPFDRVGLSDLGVFTTGDQFFEVLLPELDAQTSQSDALDFWLMGGDFGSPCSWAGTFVEIAGQLPTAPVSVEGSGQLADTGNESGLLAIVALTVTAGGALLIATSRRRHTSS